MLTIRRSDERGHADRGWLNSWFSFSFAEYEDPRHMGFGSLRVINEDWVAPGGGFPTHPHRNMEIITYVLEGAVEHRDSAGHGAVLYPGEVQYMRAGRGIQHSEFNPSTTDVLHLLQIWILPRQAGGDPGYDQRPFPAELRKGRLCPVASPDGREGSIEIGQDAVVYASLLADGETVKLTPEAGRTRIWVQVARGSVTVNDTSLSTGDAAALTGESATITGTGETAELLVFELA
ncbi:MAG: pirin family protein [Capsulimonadaceae bacterium]|nr:pirin family protein [Capsulimonadaceae bacterium]